MFGIPKPPDCCLLANQDHYGGGGGVSRLGLVSTAVYEAWMDVDSTHSPVIG